jgi:hypothetical protein
MRRLLPLFLLAIATAWPAGNPDAQAFAERIGRFHDHWNKFLRTYMGCPKSAVVVEDCDLKAGIFDYAEFNSAGREARALFARE